VGGIAVGGLPRLDVIRRYCEGSEQEAKTPAETEDQAISRSLNDVFLTGGYSLSELSAALGTVANAGGPISETEANDLAASDVAQWQTASEGSTGTLAGFDSYSTSVYPYNCVVLIESTDPGDPTHFHEGSGVVIGPHTILTCSHMLWDSVDQNIDDHVYLYPAYNQNGVPNPAGSGNPISTQYIGHFFEVGTVGADTISQSDSQYDYAVIDTSYTFTSWMGVSLNFSGGTVHVTGYPANQNGIQTDTVGTVSRDPTYSILDYGTASSSPGNSGGPLWYSSGGNDYVVGVVSTGAWACQLTSSDWTQIQTWENSDSTLWSAPADTQAPTISVDNPLSVQVGAIQTITSSFLSASDNMSSGASLRYTVTASPLYGTLLVNNSAATSFTQADINNNLVSYRETASGATSDSFSFRVSDAAGNQTGPTYFQIYISPPADTQAPTIPVDNPLSVQAGATQTITSSYLSASDNVSSGASLRYTVTASPLYGTLLVNNSVATSFTQADINNNLVSYHETASGATSDSFSFRVSDAAGNQTGATYFQIYITSSPQQPDLTVSNLTASATSFAPGASITASYSVNNIGAGTAAPSTTEIYLFDSSGHFWDLGSQAVGSISGNNSLPETSNINIPNGLTPGTYNIDVLANANGAITNEISTSNNWSNAAVVSIANPTPQQPDLTASNLTLSSSSFAPGAAITASYRVNNVGAGTAGPSTAEIYLFDSLGHFWDLGSQAVGSISGNNSLPETSNINIPNGLAPGTYNIDVLANADGTIANEASTSNNWSNAAVVSVTPPVTAQVHANDLAYSSTASGFNHFIDFLNFEASYPDLIHAFGVNQQAMQDWYTYNEPGERRIETFDGLDYIASYSDLIDAFRSGGSMRAVQDLGATHFIANGLAEGRTTTFNGLDYIASHSDLIAAFGANNDAGAFHYIENGRGEGRTTTFDGLDYIANYTDLMTAFGPNEQAGAAHFISNGLREGRTTSFNVAGYEAAHPDLQGRFATNDQFLTAYINTYVTTGHFLT
jgi:hypothetical protein